MLRRALWQMLSSGARRARGEMDSESRCGQSGGQGIGCGKVVGRDLTMADECDAEDNHPQRQKVIVDSGDRVDHARHVAKHSNESGDRREHPEVAGPAWES